MGGVNRSTRRAQDKARRSLPLGFARSPFVDRDFRSVAATPPPGLERLLESARFLVQDCARGPGRVLMVQHLDGSDGITWDDLQWIKRAAGYGDREAVEVYPLDDDVVNVANMRHLWILPAGQRLPFGLDRARARRPVVLG